MSASPAVRTLVVWCPNWPVVAAGLALDVPAAVVRANRVVACSPAARVEGVAIHQRRREAQGRCPELVVVDHDPSLDARAFEPVAATLEALTPRIELVRPGTCAFPTRGPSRYHGGDRALAGRAARLVGDALAGRGAARVGVADGAFAAGLAARLPDDVRLALPTSEAPWASDAPGTGDVIGGEPTSSVTGIDARGTGRRQVAAPDGAPGDAVDPSPVVVAPGASRGFLAGRSVRALDRPELVDVLERLGVRTLGDLAALPMADVVGRFGAEGRVVHRLAGGHDERPPATRRPPDDLAVTTEIDPPAERLEAAAFVARGLADQLAARLDGRGSACSRLVVGAETEHGERHERVWRTEGTFTAATIADRVRWQIDGWLHVGAGRPTGGLSRLWLVPDEVVPAGGRQLAFAAVGPGAVDAVEAAGRAARALARVQGMGGTDAAHVVEWRGGRGPGERMRLVPAAAVELTEPRPAAQPGWVGEPWPGQVPDPAPAVVHDPPIDVDVRDAAGRLVAVDGRGLASAPPATVAAAVPRGNGADGVAGESPATTTARVDGGGDPGDAHAGGPWGRRDRGGWRDRDGRGRRDRRRGTDRRDRGQGGDRSDGVEGDRRDRTAVSGWTSGQDAARRHVRAPGRGWAVTAWAGPWPCDERWWDPEGRRRRVRVQVVLEDGSAHLLVLEGGRWWVEATYD